MDPIDRYFGSQYSSRVLFEVLRQALEATGPVEMRVTKSQVAFYREKAFAWAWMPGKYLRGKTAPLVLTLSFPFQHPSPRWKQVVEPYPGRFVHHLELFSPDDIDDELRSWIHEAWDLAVRPARRKAPGKTR